MNAREELHSFLDSSLTGVGRRFLDELLDMHAHELAETVRAELDACDSPNDSGKCCGVSHAADLIDPEVP